MNQKIKLIQIAILVIFALSIFSCTQTETASTWQSDFETALEEGGHRNWIVVVDAAYPKQSAAGITTITTGSDHLEVLEFVLQKVEEADHVRPIIMTDAELEFLDETLVSGIDEFRTKLEAVLGAQEIKSMIHEDIIAKLDEASKLFSITVLKTTMTMPYTSVFLELDCGYWSGEKEAVMRERGESAECRVQ